MKPQVLRPGLLVSLKTSIRGAVTYDRRDLEPEHADESGAGRRARWETIKHVPDAQALDAATAVRGKARSLVTAQCSASSFGLLCPSARENDLADAIDAARALVTEHNRTSTAQVDVYVIAGRIAQDDAEAARAIAAEMRDLMDDILGGIKAADPEQIREAANKARAMGQMLTPGAAAKVSQAIEQARKIARELVKRVEKAGESAAAVVAEQATANIEAARFAFLDLDAPAEISPQDAPAARPIELEAAPESLSAAPFENRQLEL